MGYVGCKSRLVKLSKGERGRNRILGMLILKKVKFKDFVEYDILFSWIKIIIFFNFDKIFI